ncbi:hippo signaling [Homalodisca vitripennis]|nr:hippo signaling [Homalodisca vitripennis]
MSVSKLPSHNLLHAGGVAFSSVKDMTNKPPNEIPHWLSVYSRASAELDHKLRWEMFRLPELDCFNAMLTRLYKQELEEIVMRYEAYSCTPTPSHGAIPRSQSLVPSLAHNMTRDPLLGKHLLNCRHTHPLLREPCQECAPAALRSPPLKSAFQESSREPKQVCITVIAPHDQVRLFTLGGRPTPSQTECVCGTIPDRPVETGHTRTWHHYCAASGATTVQIAQSEH